MYNKEELQQALPAALNATILAFNLKYANIYTKISEKRLDLTMRMGEIKLNSLNLFDSHFKAFPRAEQGAYSTMLLGLSRSSEPDTISFLLSVVSDENSTKKILLTNYLRYYQERETLETQGKIISQAIGVTAIAPMMPFNKLLSLTAITAPNSAALPLPSRHLLSAAALGLTLGILGGTLASIALLFWKKNTVRLRTILQGPPKAKVKIEC